MRRPTRMTTLASLVAQATQLLNEGLVAPMKDFGLSPTEERVLVALTKRNGRRMFELAEYAVVKQATLSKAVDCLERKRLVERVKVDKDRRCCLVLLTGRGRKIAARLIWRARWQLSALYHSLGAADTQRLETALSHLNYVLDGIARGEAPRKSAAGSNV
jgi:DNA-binding MarR family transcriptional regulator